MTARRVYLTFDCRGPAVDKETLNQFTARAMKRGAKAVGSIGNSVRWVSLVLDGPKREAIALAKDYLDDCTDLCGWGRLRWELKTAQRLAREPKPVALPVEPCSCEAFVEPEA